MRGLSVLLSAAGIVAAFLLWRALAAAIPADPGASSMAVRIGLALGALVPAAAVLLAMTLAQAGLRFLTGALDPTRGGDGGLLRLNQRCIANTVEQLVPLAVFLPAWAAGAAATDMPGILALGSVFAVARLAFWVGYLAAPILRAPGMAASFAANVAAGVATLLAWLA